MMIRCRLFFFVSLAILSLAHGCASETGNTETESTDTTSISAMDDGSDTPRDSEPDQTTETTGSEPSSDSTPWVPCQSAVVTDIDETLTTLDSEWLKQIFNSRHDPAMRPDANTLMQGYADAGYHIFYLTARGELLRLLDGTSARQATKTWLKKHEFPFEDDDLFLASGLAAIDEEAATYKQAVVEDLMDQGWYIAYAYGNALTDIEAYKAAGIPDDRIFLVGKLAGQQGVSPIPTSEAYTEHLESFLPTVPSPQCP